MFKIKKKSNRDILLADHFCKSFIYSVLYWAEILYISNFWKKLLGLLLYQSILWWMVNVLRKIKPSKHGITSSKKCINCKLEYFYIDISLTFKIFQPHCIFVIPTLTHSKFVSLLVITSFSKKRNALCFLHSDVRSPSYISFNENISLIKNTHLQYLVLIWLASYKRFKDRFRVLQRETDWFSSSNFIPLWFVRIYDLAEITVHSLEIKLPLEIIATVRV